MKKLLLILLCLTVLFNSCSKDDNISINQEKMITWELNFGDDLWNSSQSVLQSIDSSYIVSHSGIAFGNSGESKSYLSKVSYYGDIIWTKEANISFPSVFPPLSNQMSLTSIIETVDGGYLMSVNLASINVTIESRYVNFIISGSIKKV